MTFNGTGNSVTVNPKTGAPRGQRPLVTCLKGLGEARLEGELEVDFPEGVATLRADPRHAAAYPRSELEKIMLGLRCAPAVTEGDQAGWYELSTALGS